MWSYLWHADWGWCCILTAMLSIKHIIESPIYPEGLKEVKIGHDWVFLLPGKTASLHKVQGHENRSWRGKPRLRALGDPVQVAGVMSIPLLLGEGRLHICKQEVLSTKEAMSSKGLCNTLHAHSKLALSIAIVWWGWKVWKFSFELWVIKQFC